MSNLPKLNEESFSPVSGVLDRASLRRIVCERTRSQCENSFNGELRAIVLTGSLARDEASFQCNAGCWELFGDAEFLLVLEKNHGRSRKTLNTLRQRIENDLRQRQIKCTIDLSAVSESYFRELPPHIFSYELKRCGKVICGEDRVLQLIPDFSVSDLSREDAWRLLCNRMIEQFAFVEDLSRMVSELTPRLHYATVKLYLDMATSYLVFAGAYEATYAERAKTLRLLAAQATSTSNTPFLLKDFSERVSACTDWKLSGGAPSDLRREFWEQAIDFASHLWRWEVIQLTKAPSDSSTSVLYDHLTQQLKFTDKLRGWASAVKRSGGLRSWYSWPRWVQLGLRATPRYLVYRVGTELFFRLTYLVRNPNRPATVESDLVELKSFLPTPGSSARSGQVSWQVLAYQVFNNYLQLVTSTRA
jgi:hypothetical protein